MINKLLKVGDWDIAYDGERLADHFVVRGVSMSLLPNIEVNELTVDGRPGSWFAGRNIETRDIKVGLGVLARSRDRVEVMEDWLHVSGYIGKREPKVLELGGGYHVMAMLVGSTELVTKGAWSITTATFRCFDPYIYGPEHVTRLRDGANKVKVYGQQPVRPVFKVVPSGTSFELENGDTGKFVRVPKVEAGKELTIDMDGYRCTFEGRYKPADPTVTSFWPLQVGENAVVLRNGSGEFRYREAYL